jgi:peptidoglycan/LPS O-acetylase OafA/YrhL
MGGRRYAYSPALDGVRAIAMACIVVYHFGFDGLQGAWLGINLFFVLSAFLIVRLLVSEYDARGRIDILGFYRRRARRLLPALLIVLGTIAGWALFAAPADSRGRTGGDILATLGFVQNWRLIGQADPYFLDTAAPSMLRHAWTPAVEEQFYVVVPFLLVLLLRVLRRRGERVAALLALSGVVAVWTSVLGLHSASHLPRVYYGTDVRAQSLLVGAALGVLLARREGGDETPAADGRVRLAGLVGLAVTVGSFVLVGPYAGWLYNSGGLWLLSLAAAGLVLACAVGGNPVSQVLGWRPLAWVGRLSYGLYLWHWPIHLWLGDDRVAGSTLATGVVGIGLTFALATLSYLLVERRVIRGGVRALLPARAGLGAVVATSLVPLLVVALAGVNLLGSGSTPAVAAPGSSASAAPRSSATPTASATLDPLHRPDTAPTNPAVGPIPDIVAGQSAYVPGTTLRIALYGDSVALGMARGFPAASYPDVSIASVVQEGCDLLTDDIYWAKDILQPNRQECTWLKANWPAFVVEHRSQVMVAFVSPLLIVKHQLPDGTVVWLDDARYVRQVEDAFEELRSRARRSGVQRLVLVNNPCRPWLTADNWKVIDQDRRVIAEWKRPTRLNALVSDFARKHADVQIVDLYAAVCGPGRNGTVAGVPLTRDDIHFNPKATPAIWKFVLGQVRP